jgi:hypothetical protein
MSDVAAAAKVSVTTVSNVLNSPHRVGSQTRGRVQAAIEMLGYQRSEAAYQLRHGAKKRASGGEARVPHLAGTFDVDHSDDDRTHGDSISGSPPAPDRPRQVLAPVGLPAETWPAVSEGNAVVISSNGFETTGLVDAVMPDGSAVWVWTSNGDGRRLIHVQDGVVIRMNEA